nr:hypothetical protein LTR18_004332 [Exophiala xenobiotica]
MEQTYPLSPYFDDRASRISAVSDTSYYGPAVSTSSTSHLNPIPRKAVPISQSTDYDPVINPIDVQDHQPVRRFGGNSFLRWWGAEIVASILSIASLLSIVILLKEYEGKGINDLGLPSWLTLNGIVATIATLNRVCMMLPVGSALSQEAWLWFSGTGQTGKVSSRLQDLERSDAASRGAWGSLVLLFVSRRRYLAYFGALVTILSLAFGTFTQQLISYSMYPIPSSHADLLPGNIPQAETWQNFTGNPAEGAMSIPLTMKAAIYNGMLSEGVQPITATCPTGNCTWPVTPSLAVCGECSSSSYQTSCNRTECTYTMPSGSKMLFPNATYSTEGLGFQVTASKGAKYNSSHHDKLYIANFDVFGAQYDSYSYTGWEKYLTSQECAMWICIKTFDVVTANGHQTQTVSSTFSLINSTLPSGFSGGDNFTFPPLPANMSGTTPNTNYTFNIFASVALSEYLSPLFNGTVFLNLESNSPSRDAVEALWNGTSDMNAWMSNVALSMTNIMRSTTQANRAVYDGSASQLGVHIRWPWIALPASMVLASLVFLILIIIETTRSPVEAWKGSPLAYLIFGVDQETKGSLENHAIVDEYKDLGNTVGRTKAILKHQPTGKWTFQKAS